MLTYLWIVFLPTGLIACIFAVVQLIVFFVTVSLTWSSTSPNWRNIGRALECLSQISTNIGGKLTNHLDALSSASSCQIHISWHYLAASTCEKAGNSLMKRILLSVQQQVINSKWGPRLHPRLSFCSSTYIEMSDWLCFSLILFL